MCADSLLDIIKARFSTLSADLAFMKSHFAGNKLTPVATSTLSPIFYKELLVQLLPCPSRSYLQYHIRSLYWFGPLMVTFSLNRNYDLHQVWTAHTIFLTFRWGPSEEQPENIEIMSWNVFILLFSYIRCLLQKKPKEISTQYCSLYLVRKH